MDVLIYWPCCTNDRSLYEAQSICVHVHMCFLL